ncbi:MAG TPA: hypothetical protein VGL35_05495 [Rhizomicrobium sp.]
MARTVYMNTVILCAAAAFAASPALAADVSAEITNAALHAGYAAQGNDIGTVHTHLHHTVNCLVGPGGAGFDAKELNPCANTGNGAIPDSTNAATKGKLQSALATANSGLAATDLATAKKDAADAEAALKTAS